MKYKHACIVDEFGSYKKFALVFLEPDENGNEQEKIQNYALLEGEQIVETQPPFMRPNAGASGFVHPVWNMESQSWTEDATLEEIVAWEAEHPAPEIPTQQPTMDQRVTDLEDAYTALLFGGEAI